MLSDHKALNLSICTNRPESPGGATCRSICGSGRLFTSIVSSIERGVDTFHFDTHSCATDCNIRRSSCHKAGINNRKDHFMRSIVLLAFYALLFTVF